MASLLFTCPTTHQQAPTGIETDVQSLHAAWKAESEMPILRRGARNLGARDVYQWCATGCYRPVTPVHLAFGWAPVAERHMVQELFRGPLLSVCSLGCHWS
jgi:hypothetical protein